MFICLCVLHLNNIKIIFIRKQLFLWSLLLTISLHRDNESQRPKQNKTLKKKPKHSFYFTISCLPPDKIEKWNLKAFKLMPYFHYEGTSTSHYLPAPKCSLCEFKHLIHVRNIARNAHSLIRFQNGNIFPNTSSSWVKKEALFLLVWNFENKTVIFLELLHRRWDKYLCRVIIIPHLASYRKVCGEPQIWYH